MYPSRKYKNTLKRKYSIKLKGGQPQQKQKEKREKIELPNDEVNQEKLAEEIAQKHPGIVGPALNLAGNMANNVASQGIKGASLLLGVNLENKDAVNNSLEKLKKTLSDPETLSNIKQVVGDGAKVFAASIEASKPAISKLVSTTTDAISKSSEKIGNAGVNIVMNTLEEIPGVGIIVGTARSADKAGQAVQSLFNAGSEIVAASGDAVNQIARNMADVKKSLQKTMEEKTSISKQLGGSIAEFHNSTLNPEKFISKYQYIRKPKTRHIHKYVSRRTRRH